VRRFGVAALAVLALFASAFLLVAAFEITILRDPTPSLDRGGVAGAALGVALLVGDAVLPVPSSLVMISLSALYGPWLGIPLAVLGRFGMAIGGFAAGRRGAPLFMRFVAEPERAFARDLVERWGAVAIVVSRPVPLLAETVVVLAGAARLPWRQALPAALLGSLPEAIAYGLIGAAAATFANGALVWIAFLVVGTLLRIALRYRAKSQTTSAISSTRTSTAGT
jgi:uncharacterized membrane protein YdjX (TVP38/TMEM64 family)